MDSFETHVTVDFDERLPAWAAGAGLKYTRIRLARGATTDQPMLTGTGHGDLAAQRATAEALVDRLRGDGFTVRRVKIEAAPWNSAVPVEPGPTGECYFEHHVKLVLRGGDEPTGTSAAGTWKAGKRSRPGGSRRRTARTCPATPGGSATTAGTSGS
ncbi:hypothetical protein ACFO1B_34530 [Dactylosporangium siamense]|uniref:Uncharacterized protein n=1 Tax=Dactylosporangium siamense TaxID=685454 RepID=A0A919PMG2_9ACTN|nr:hypothetical protein [Dactylosporangium siamense]GIG44763.1 hypothetical protein Dsi01nite_028040 [Dactylosporangium siamense]